MLTVALSSAQACHIGVTPECACVASIGQHEATSSLRPAYLQPESRVVVWAYECDICDLSRAGAEENQKKQEVLGICVPRDLLFAEADLRLDAQLDCKRAACV